MTKFDIPFADLAGSIFLTLPSGLHILQLKTLIQNNLEVIYQRKNKIKVIFDNYNLEDIKSIFDDIPSLDIGDYNSHFFKLTKDEIVGLKIKSPQLDWQNYSNEFIIKKYHSNQKEILLNILLNSFAVNFSKDKTGKSIITTNKIKQKYILENFGRNSQNSDLNTFIIYSKLGEIVGTFGLTVVGNEVQLTAVAGRFEEFKNFKPYSEAKKLPLISAAFVETFGSSSTFELYNNLTFSNSKASVIKFYSDLGFKDNTYRKGFIID